MSIHNDPRRNSLDEDEYRAWENDLRMEYAREEYEMRHPYDDDDAEIKCDWQGDDGSCNYDGHCAHQTGKWKDTCDCPVYDDEEGEEEWS